MFPLDAEAYNWLLKTEQVTLEVSHAEKGQGRAITKPGSLVDKDGKLQLANGPAAAVKILVPWCHGGQLHYVFECQKVGASDLDKRKSILIDIWFFCDM
ncbi:Hypothetical predicted protein [Lecanosticta acicola]|uniref:Uncharacterized protein n=1 Tax=Lecanosticta acicola TaxID=111012 RepID=A0AAI8Z8G3_9PEZI|nr:Hypothetical predicted protein [Lecanosticta acicola]